MARGDRCVVDVWMCLLRGTSQLVGQEVSPLSSNWLCVGVFDGSFRAFVFERVRNLMSVESHLEDVAVQSLDTF